MAVIVLVPAAGSGRRMGADRNKQYLLLQGRPILARTLALFEGHSQVDAIYVISPREEIAFCREEVVQRYGFRKVADVVEGGRERQDSVFNGLEACQGRPGDIVLIHDGVRPLFSAELIPSIVETAARVGGCVVGVPAKDTVKEVDSGRIRRTPPRERLWMAQTPQAFPFSVIRQAHQQARREGFRGTDDASLVERLDLPVALLEGSYRNIKITTPEDLVLAEAFLKEKTP